VDFDAVESWFSSSPWPETELGKKIVVMLYQKTKLLVRGPRPAGEAPASRGEACLPAARVPPWPAPRIRTRTTTELPGSTSRDLRRGPGRDAPQLGGDRRVDRTRHVERTAARAVEAAGRVGAGMDQARAQIGRVATSLQHVRAATGPAEKALERTVERLGAAAVNTATSLLPKGLQLPIRVAVYALDRALDLARGLGLGR
jgi:hypothetical protein